MTLEESGNKSLFISKVALIFLIYSAVCLFVCFYITNNPEKSRDQFIHGRLEVTFYLYFSISLLIKMIFSFFGNFIRNFSKIVFIIDILLAYNIVLGFYYILNKTGKFHYTNNSYYVIIACYLFFFNSIAFFLSTFFVDKKKTYNYYVGIFLLEITTVLTVFIFKIKFP